MLDVVFRTCEHTSVHPERGDRFIVCDKTTLIKKFISVIKEYLVEEEKDINDQIIDLYIIALLADKLVIEALYMDTL